MTNPSYDTDFYAWTQAEAQALHKHGHDLLDICADCSRTPATICVLSAHRHFRRCKTKRLVRRRATQHLRGQRRKGQETVDKSRDK